MIDDLPQRLTCVLRHHPRLIHPPPLCRGLVKRLQFTERIRRCQTTHSEELPLWSVLLSEANNFTRDTICPRVWNKRNISFIRTMCTIWRLGRLWYIRLCVLVVCCDECLSFAPACW